MMIKVILFSLTLNLVSVHQSTSELTRDHYAVADRKEKIQMGDGDYKYAYINTNGIIKNETGYIKNPEAPMDEQINAKEGCYSYTSPEGAFVSVTYTADERGFNPKTRITYPGEPNHEQHVASPCGPLSGPVSLPLKQAARPVSSAYLPPSAQAVSAGAYLPPKSQAVSSGAYLPPPSQAVISTQSVGFLPADVEAVSAGAYLPPPTAKAISAPYLPPRWEGTYNGWAKPTTPKASGGYPDTSIWDIPKIPPSPIAPIPTTRRPVAVPAKPAPLPTRPPAMVPVKPTEYTTAVPPTTSKPLPKRTQLPPENYPATGGYPINNNVQHQISTLTTCACPERIPESFSFRLADGSYVLVTYDSQGLSYKPAVKVYPNGVENYYTCQTNTLSQPGNKLPAVSYANTNNDSQQKPSGGYAG